MYSDACSKARPPSSLCSDLRRIPIITSQHPWIPSSDKWPISTTGDWKALALCTSQGSSPSGQGTIDVLPDDVLLDIFDVCTDEDPCGWPTLVHVCRRWRGVAFASIRRLNLRLRCTSATPVRKMLDIWPALLPITIEVTRGRFSRAKAADNVVAALGHRDRVCRIELWNIPKSSSDRLAAAMKEPFPELTFLLLSTKTVLDLPDSFLGGSAPRLQTLSFNGISFPAIPKLLSSASDLVDLTLYDIPHSARMGNIVEGGYISPEAMVTCLSPLARLERLSIGFQSPRSLPGSSKSTSVDPHRSPCSHLFFGFEVSASTWRTSLPASMPPYSAISTLAFFNQLIFNTPRLSSFISRAEKLRSQSQACMTFCYDIVQLSHTKAGGPRLNLTILCGASDWQLSSLTQFCRSPFLSLSNLERLEICENSYSGPQWQEDVDNIQWLELLLTFTAVKGLSLSKEFTPRVVPALQELSGERIMDVLPALRSISLSETSLSGPVKEAFEQFLTARQLSGHPVAVNPEGQE
ncbi:hypothetical protein BC826DRAFT_1106271 [Russula brevipes]|nr:hypothetical protein BC826DRAFT_1106271 [Russula brevipes]